MTKEHSNTILQSHILLKESRDGTLKGITVAGSNKQRDFISKEDASSPTVSTESVLLTCIIYTEEHRDVATMDISNLFIRNRNEDEKNVDIIKIREVLLDIILEIALDVYEPYFIMDRKGVTQLIVQC